jgi:hypothetical protein
LFQLGLSYIAYEQKQHQESQINEPQGHRPLEEELDAALGIIDQERPRLIEFLYCMG